MTVFGAGAGVAGVLLSVELPAALAAAAGAASAAVVAGAVPVFGALPPRKSVTYQPVPLSWKAGADSCRAKDSAPQDGQTVSVGSDIFCSTSFWWPQASQR